MVKNLYDYLAKPAKTIGEHVEDLLYRANILRKLGYIKDIHIYNLLIKACEWHDVGKANKEFLKRVLNPKLHFDETKEIAHNILSVYYLDKNEFEEDTDDYFIVACCILFHHDYCDEASVIGEHSSQINSLLIPEYNCNPDERDLLELDCYLEMQETIIVKGLLHRCDYSASGNYEIEYPNDFLEAGLTQMMNEWQKKKKDSCWNELQEFCIENREENIIAFVDYQSDYTDCEVSTHSLVIKGKVIEMTKVVLSDFGILYDVLSIKKAAFPVKLLRRFKDELYTFALTQQPGPTMQVAALDDGRIDENMLALSIGLASTGVYGLARAVNSEQWYRNIILHDSVYSSDMLLEYVYPELAKQNSWKLPVWYYIKNSDFRSKLAENKAPHSYDEIVSEASIKRNKTAIAGRTAMEIWTDEKDNMFKAIRLLGFLPEDKIDVDQYEQILEMIFEENANILSSLEAPNRSNLNRMIRIFDYFRYGPNKKTP